MVFLCLTLATVLFSCAIVMESIMRNVFEFEQVVNKLEMSFKDISIFALVAICSAEPNDLGNFGKSHYGTVSLF